MEIPHQAKKQKERIQEVHCDQDCMLESKALQCGLCHNWVHSDVMKAYIASELFKLLNDMCSGTVNVSY